MVFWCGKSRKTKSHQPLLQFQSKQMTTNKEGRKVISIRAYKRLKEMEIDKPRSIYERQWAHEFHQLFEHELGFTLGSAWCGSCLTKEIDRMKIEMGVVREGYEELIETEREIEEREAARKERKERKGQELPKLQLSHGAVKALKANLTDDEFKIVYGFHASTDSNYSSLACSTSKPWSEIKEIIERGTALAKAKGDEYGGSWAV